MSNTPLSEARVKTLKPRNSTYDLRDAKLKGFGVRVLPSGAKRFFVHTQHRGERTWKMVGDANAMSLEEARKCSASMLAAIRGRQDATDGPETTVFEAVAETVFERFAKVWKPGTLEVNRNHLRRQLIPWFAGRQIADIDRRDVQRWFASHDPGSRGPVRAGAFGNHEGGGASRLPPRGVESGPRDQALPPQGARTVPFRGGASPPCSVPVGIRARAVVSSRGRTTASAHRVPMQRSTDPSLVGLSRRTPPRSGRQGRTEDRVALRRRPGGP